MAWVDTRVPTSYGDVFGLVCRITFIVVASFLGVAFAAAALPANYDGRVCWGLGVGPFTKVCVAEVPEP
jgi:hypothetical protein